MGIASADDAVATNRDAPANVEEVAAHYQRAVPQAEVSVREIGAPWAPEEIVQVLYVCAPPHLEAANVSHHVEVADGRPGAEHDALGVKIGQADSGTRSYLPSEAPVDRVLEPLRQHHRERTGKLTAGHGKRST